jgi:hypothetical protein
MLIRAFPHSFDGLVFFRQSRLLIEIIFISVQLRDISRDELALRVVPWTVADSIAGVDSSPAGFPGYCGRT